MAETSMAKKSGTSGQEDRISDLPEGLLQHILGFLPADQAVRTSILARRWQHLWRSMRRLRITNEGSWKSADDLIKFMNSLLLLCPDVALEEVEFRGIQFLYPVDDSTINIWIRHVLLRRAQVLSVHLPLYDMSTFQGPALVAQSLRKLELGGVFLEGSFLDFASCPALEYIEITYCYIGTDRLSSQSVKHLVIGNVTFLYERTHISVPSLISLQLKCYEGRSPLLEDMPSLEAAMFCFGPKDYCTKGAVQAGLLPGCCCAKCYDGDNGGQDSCILILGGFSSAINLELIIDSGTLIFSRWCPTFSKLKTLLLHVREEVNDLQWMVCILEHSPILEELTITVPKVRGARKLEQSNQPTEQLSVISERLNAVEIKCGQIDEMVYNILKLLGRFVKEINIKLTGQP